MASKRTLYNRKKYLRLEFYLSDDPARDRTPRSHGRRTGMGIFDFLNVMFQANENVHNHKRMTDEVIRRELIKEFPDVKSVKRLQKGEITVGYYRTLYNFGKMNTLQLRPEQRSYRYNVKGHRVNDKTATPLSKERIAVLEARHKQLREEQEKKRNASIPDITQPSIPKE